MKLHTKFCCKIKKRWRSIRPHIRTINDDYSQFIIAFTSICVLMIVFFQFNNLTRQLEESVQQTKLLTKSYKESYRPLGVLKVIKREEFYAKYDENRKVLFNYEPNIINVGQGTLLLTGYMYSILPKGESLRQNILNSSEKDLKVQFDSLSNDLRLVGIAKNDTGSINIKFENLTINTSYNGNIIFFYKDHNGNLFDTEHIFKFFCYKIKGKSHLGTTVYGMNKFNAYDKNENSKIIEYIKNNNSNLWEYLIEP